MNAGAFGSEIKDVLLGLNRNCRLFEIKNACYSGAAGIQMAVNFAPHGLVFPGNAQPVLSFDVRGATLIDAAPQDCRIDGKRCGA